VVDINRLYIVLIFLLAGCVEQSPEDIAQDSLIVDTHIDTPYRIKTQLDNSDTYEDIAQNTSYDFDYPRALSGGLNVPFFSIYLPADTEAAGTSFNLANELIDLMNSIMKPIQKNF
jgi:Membrane dipeptidase (Peptidase family M19).